MTVTEFLKDQVPFLSGLDEAQARELATSAQQTSFQKGQLILMQGETVDSLHVVASGKVAVSRKEKGSKTIVLLAELGPGKVFGETSILEMGTAGATVRAAEESLLFIIPQAAFMKVMADNSELKARLLAKIAARPQKPPPRD